MRDKFVEAVINFAKDDNFFFLTADLGFGSFDKLEKIMGKNFINVGVCEQNMVNISSGIALSDKNIKVIIYSIGNFPTLRCLEQIRNNICYHKLKILIVTNGVGFSYGQLGMSHHATEDFGIMRSLPYLEILSPCSSLDAFEITYEWLSKGAGPAYLRLDKSEYKGILPKLIYSKNYRILNGDNHNKEILEIYLGGIASLLNNKKQENDVCLVYKVTKGTLNEMVELLDQYNKIIVFEEQNQDAGFCQYISWHCSKGKNKKELIVKCIPNVLPSFVGDQSYMRNQLGIRRDD
tara:strand:+ start:160 stop:1035 length:876 start_codon:yes stop_codon:yes gene_type:complete